MNREEIKNKIINLLKQKLTLPIDPLQGSNIQMSFFYGPFENYSQRLSSPEKKTFKSTIREIIQEFINNGFLYPGLAEDENSSYPWLTVTCYGKEVFVQDSWLPYDPEGYLKALKEKINNIDDITFAYIGEAIVAYNRRQLLSATMTLGVASENLMLLLIEAYQNWIENEDRKTNFEKRIRDKFIYAQYKEFKKEFLHDIKTLPLELQADWETYLDGVFNFIRLNRNSAGHPTGKQFDIKVIYANLQIFSEYAAYIFNLIKYFSSATRMGVNASSE